MNFSNHTFLANSVYGSTFTTLTNREETGDKVETVQIAKESTTFSPSHRIDVKLL